MKKLFLWVFVFYTILNTSLMGFSTVATFTGTTSGELVVKQIDFDNDGDMDFITADGASGVYKYI